MYNVPGMDPKALIAQQHDMSCWYASARMLIHWKMNQRRQSIADLIPPELDAQCVALRDANFGINNSQIITMAKRLGLRAIPPMSPTPQAIEQWLRLYGPLWTNGKTHIVVIAGINGDNVQVFDSCCSWLPSYVISINTQLFSQFINFLLAPD